MTEEVSELLGITYDIEFECEKIDLRISISVCPEIIDIEAKFVSVLFYRNIQKEKRGIDDLMTFELLSEYKKVNIENISNLQKEMKSEDNMNQLMEEFAKIMKSNFLGIIEGKAWIKGLFPDWG